MGRRSENITVPILPKNPRKMLGSHCSRSPLANYTLGVPAPSRKQISLFSVEILCVDSKGSPSKNVAIKFFAPKSDICAQTRKKIIHRVGGKTQSRDYSLTRYANKNLDRNLYTCCACHG